MCCGAMVWTKLGRLVYGASDRDLCEILGEEGNDCAEMIFDHSPFRPAITGGVLRERSIRILKAYFKDHGKG